MNNQFNYFYLTALIKKSIDVREMIDELEEKRIWISIIPCKIVLSRQQIESAIKLAIRDFLQNENRAKKINIQFILRFLGERQISSALEKIASLKDPNVCIVVFYPKTFSEKETVSILTRQLLENDTTNLTKSLRCKPDLSVIKNIYKVTKNEIRSVLRDKEDIKEGLIKIILERIALSFLR